VTVPDGVPLAPDRLAESCTDPPTATDEAERVVATVGVAFPTVNGSLAHGLIAALLLVSPP
jgi:hypothetical protein